MSFESPLSARHSARLPVALAAAAAILAGGSLSLSAALSRPGQALASTPRLSWPTAGLASSLLPVEKVTPVPAGTPAAAPFILHAKSPAERERAVRCLTTAIYYEAALEPDDGQRAVAQVILNRVRDPNFPKSICGVVFQGWSQPPGCQFSFTCDGSLARAPMPQYWNRARAVAEQALNGAVMPEVGLATHYHTTYVSPWWRTTVVRIAQVGSHIFYRWPGAAGQPGAFTGRYAGGELALSEAVLTGRVLAPKLAPALLAGVQAQKVTVPNPAAPGGQATRVHMVLGGAAPPAPFIARLLPGAVRPPPTPEQVAKINALLARKFPSEPAAAVPTPAPSAAPAAASSDKPSPSPSETDSKPVATATSAGS